MSGRRFSRPSPVPRFATTLDPGVPTFGPAIEQTAAYAFRRALMPWQRSLVDVIGATTDDGSAMRYPYVVVHVPRRAGKSLSTFASLIHRTMTGSAVWCHYTAQTREAAAKTFRKEWTPLVTSSPLYPSRLKLRRSNGSEEVMLTAGGEVVSSVALFAPGPLALHGSDADMVCVDEAWSFTLDAGSDLEAGIQPAQLTRPRRQILIVSAGGTAASSWLARWIQLGRDQTPGVALVDYGAEPDDDPDDPDVWTRVHPAIGHTVTLDAVAGLRATMPDDEFRRAVLGLWLPDPDAGTVIDRDRWDAARDPAAAPGDPVTFGLAVSPAGDAALAAAGLARDGSGRIAVEVVDARPGTGWVPDAWRAIRARTRGRLLVDPLSPAAPLLDRLVAARLPVEPTTTVGYVTACLALVDDVDAGRIVHRGQGALDAAVTAVRTRTVGDRWVWDRRASPGVEFVESVTLAASGARRPRTAPSIASA